MAVLTRTQLESLSKEQLIVELLKTKNEVNEQLILINLKFDKLVSELSVSKNVSNLLTKRIIQLEKNQLNTSQYIRRHMAELNPIPAEIEDDKLEEVVCAALSLCGEAAVTSESLHSCQRLKKNENVIVYFKDRKLRDQVMKNRRVLKEKSSDLEKLNLTKNLYINDSLCAENSLLFYQARRLKKLKKIHETWFFNQTINIKTTETALHIVSHGMTQRQSTN